MALIIRPDKEVDIYVRCMLGAARFNPESKKAVVVRINGVTAHLDYPSLEHAASFSAVLECDFDDIREVPKPGSTYYGYIPFDADKASKLITDFSSHVKGLELLLVHCHMGRSRSPAIAQALSDIFHLSCEDISPEYPRFNSFVYDIMIKQARVMGYDV